MLSTITLKLTTGNETIERMQKYFIRNRPNIPNPWLYSRVFIVNNGKKIEFDGTIVTITDYVPQDDEVAEVEVRVSNFDMTFKFFEKNPTLPPNWWEYEPNLVEASAVAHLLSMCGVQFKHDLNTIAPMHFLDM